jgi:hypothetical protein
VELAAVQQLVAAIGPIGAMAVIGAWWFVTHKEKRGDAADHTARTKARDAIIQISADIKHMQQDIAEIKADAKTTSTTLVQHVSQQHTRSR